MWLIALILFWGVLLLAVVALQRSRGEAVVASGTCPTCEVPLQGLVPGPAIQPPRHWQVLACPSCELAAAVVQGVPGSAGWCPACQQHALELSAERLPAEAGAPIRVAVSELCHLCGHEAEVVVEHRPLGQRGKVIPFPGSRD